MDSKRQRARKALAVVVLAGVMAAGSLPALAGVYAGPSCYFNGWAYSNYTKTAPGTCAVAQPRIDYVSVGTGTPGYAVGSALSFDSSTPTIPLGQVIKTGNSGRAWSGGAPSGWVSIS